jgi:hypothetical protein
MRERSDPRDSLFARCTPELSATPTSPIVHPDKLKKFIDYARSGIVGMISRMIKRTIGLSAGVAAAVLTTIFVLPHILLFVFVCLFELGCALYQHQAFQPDFSNPTVKRGVQLNEETRRLAVQHIGPGTIDGIASAYFPPGNLGARRNHNVDGNWSCLDRRAGVIPGHTARW